METKDLRGKTAWIGGASKGLGKACAIALAERGARVIMTSRDPESLQKAVDLVVSAGGSAIALPADLSKPDQVTAAVNTVVQNYLPCDILVLNSGGPKPGGFMSLTDADWQEGYHQALGYMLSICKAVIPSMLERRSGRIITITSIVAAEPAETLALSSVFRGGVLNMVKILSKDLASQNITVNNVSPGAFKTDRAIMLMEARAKATGQKLAEIESSAVAALPTKRYQTPDECGAAVAFLASASASGITGIDLRVDGGISKSI